MDWKHLRYNLIDNLSAIGATGTGMLLSAPGQVYFLRGMAYTAAGRMALYDHTNLPQNPIDILTPGTTAPDETPRIPISLSVQRGLYVSFSMGTGGLAVLAGWERQ